MASPMQESLRLAHGAFAQGRIDESRRRCAELLELAPADAQALHLAAVIELSSGDPQRALDLVGRAVAADAADPRQHHTRGLALRALQRNPEAVESFREAVRLSPQFAEGYAALGRALFAARDAKAAVQALTRALQIDPRSHDAHNDLGVAQLHESRVADAEASFRRAIELAPDRPHAWNNLGNALRIAGRREEAVAAFRNATQRQPAMPGAWVNLGNMLREGDLLEESAACLDRALGMDPASAAAHLSAAITRLLAGDFERGWADYAWREGAPESAARDALQSIEPGTTVEIAGEQGLGDVLFFLRWARGLRARGARLSFRGDRRLFPLLARTGEFENYVAPDAAPSEAGVAIRAGDLPWAAGPGESHPAPLALEASPQALEDARALLAAAGPPPYVAVAWRAGIASSGAAEHLEKEIDLAAFAPALAAVEATYISVQREAREGEPQRLAALAGRRMLDASALNSDLEAMLGLLAAVDGYAGVSSTNVHLLAGLGRRANVVVPHPPEWRYGRSGETSRWFPQFRLHRQGRNGDWTEAMRSLAADLLERFPRP